MHGMLAFTDTCLKELGNLHIRIWPCHYIGVIKILDILHGSPHLKLLLMGFLMY